VKNFSIRVSNLEKQFEQKKIIKKISFNLPSQGIFGVLGKNGAGKTTLLGLLMGLITPTSGDIFILGKDIKKHKENILNQINFQSPYVELPKKMTVIQNLFFYARLYGVSDYHKIVNKLSDDLKINDLLSNNYGSLSAGQKTKVNLCKALINSPKLLLLDEPTASLDPETSIFVRNYLINYQKENKSTILLTSHNLDEIQNMCSYVLFIKSGKVVSKGKIEDLLKKNNFLSVKDFFLENSQC
tara:strand:+ start:387 stop:1112 length:726 start_codon:yes stop_codon:yes gene_type:complete